jgi:hypothetical protein
MSYNFIYAGANAFGEFFVAKAGGNCAVFQREFAHKIINFLRSNAGLAHFASSGKRFRRKRSAIPDSLNLFSRFNDDF